MTPATPSRANPAALNAPGHCSHGALATVFAFVSAQRPARPAGDRLVDSPFDQQTGQVLANRAAVPATTGTPGAQG